jgi:hypothetical protein
MSINGLVESRNAIVSGHASDYPRRFSRRVDLDKALFQVLSDPSGLAASPPAVVVVMFDHEE